MVLSAIIILILFFVPAVAHKSILINTKQNVFIQPTSIRVSHIIDCGSKSLVNILPLLDADKNGEIGEDEIKALSSQIKNRIVKRESNYKALLDRNTILLPFQELVIHYEPPGDNIEVEITFFRDGFSFKEGRHRLVMEREGYRIDIPVLMAMLGYPDSPKHGHGVPAHLVRISLHCPSNFKILDSNLGFIPTESPSLLKGVFLTLKQPKLEVDFEVLPHNFPSN